VSGRFIYGVHPVEEALRAGKIEAVFLADGDDPRLGLIARAASERKVPIDTKSKAELSALCETDKHQGVVALRGEYAYSSLDDILDRIGAREDDARQPLVLVLDSIQDPGNLGAILRSAHIFGVDGVVIPRDRAARVNATVVKASAGATEHLAIALETNLQRSLERCKEAGLWIAGAVAEGGSEPFAQDLDLPLALLLGAEGKGIRPLLQKSCDLRLRIPMLGQVASLNVSVAGGILLYEVVRQRLSKQEDGE
jgi:23S rRNA (guanosine2251-2'-O)-methyltransferase